MQLFTRGKVSAKPKDRRNIKSPLVAYSLKVSSRNNRVCMQGLIEEYGRWVTGKSVLIALNNGLYSQSIFNYG